MLEDNEWTAGTYSPSTTSNKRDERCYHNTSWKFNSKSKTFTISQDCHFGNSGTWKIERLDENHILKLVCKDGKG